MSSNCLPQQGRAEGSGMASSGSRSADGRPHGENRRWPSGTSAHPQWASAYKRKLGSLGTVLDPQHRRGGHRPGPRSGPAPGQRLPPGLAPRSTSTRVPTMSAHCGQTSRLDLMVATFPVRPLAARPAHDRAAGSLRRGRTMKSHKPKCIAGGLHGAQSRGTRHKVRTVNGSPRSAERL